MAGDCERMRVDMRTLFEHLGKTPASVAAA
jgi:hypothetical protein